MLFVSVAIYPAYPPPPVCRLLPLSFCHVPFACSVVSGRWIVPTFIYFNHVFAVYGLFWDRMWNVDAAFKWWCLFFCFLSLLGITGGYHRLWSHRAFKASFSLRVFLAIIGCISFQGSIKWWVLRHRTHHR